MLTYPTLIQSLSNQLILPLYYHADAAVCISRLRALYAGGIRLIEFTNRGENALANFSAMKKVQENEFPDLLLGVGTIYNLHQATSFKNAGAHFLISPIFSKEVADFCNQEKVPYVPGCMTPTEIFTATTSGCKLIKLFPGHVLGATFIKSIQELFPGIVFMPTGGINPTKDNLQEWFDGGALAVGVGSPLFKSISTDQELTAMVKSIVGMKK